MTLIICLPKKKKNFLQNKFATKRILSRLTIYCINSFYSSAVYPNRHIYLNTAKSSIFLTIKNTKEKVQENFNMDKFIIYQDY